MDGISCTDDTLAENVLSTIILNKSNDQKVFVGEDSKPILSSNKSLLQESSSNGKCQGKENCKLPNPTETKQSYKVKLFACSYCEKAFTSNAFLVKHEKYHVENDSQEKVCDDFDKARSEDSISSDPGGEQKKTYEDCQLTKDFTEQDSGVSTLVNSPPSSEADSIPPFEDCFQCGKSSTSLDEFDTHLQEHLKEQFCNPCQKVYKTPRQFVKHVISFHVTKRHKCHLCKSKFLIKNSLTGHLKHFHKIPNKDERGSYSHKCGSCKASFNLSDKLMEHQEMMKHKGTEYQCHECEKHYTVLSDLQQHLTQEHNRDTQSTSSSLSNKSYEKPLQHEESDIKKIDCSDSVPQDGEEKGKQRFWCYKCNVSYIWKYDLVRHKIKKKCCMDKPVVQVNGNSQLLICRYDDKVFDDKKKFGKHYIRHFLKSTAPIDCDQCTKTFLTFESLEKHLAVHLEEKIKEANNNGCLKPYSCEVCGKSFGNKKYCRRHIYRIHNKKKPDKAMGKFCCDICNKVFSHRTTLSSHKKTHSLPVDEVQQATDRDTSTNTAPEPQTKQKKPAEIYAKGNGTFRRYKCSTCHKRFFNSECLSRHKKLLNHGERLHLRSSHVAETDAEPKSRPGTIYHCNVCKRSFKYYNVFYRHRSAHKGEKGCKTCGKVFKASMLSNHTCLSCKNTPRKNGFYNCKACDKGFLELRSLKDHVKAHIDGHFDCKSCRIAFSSAERLDKHMKNHKNEVSILKNMKQWKAKLHECNNCEKFYAGRRNLMRHRNICMKNNNYQPQDSPVDVASKKDSVEEVSQNKSDKKSQDFSCQKCHKSYSLFSEFYSHCSEHGEEKPCCKCLRFLSSSGSLKRHLVEKHSQDHTFYCHMCPEEFHDLNGLISHITLVQGVRRHNCKECGQAFALCNRLMEHVKLMHAKK